MKQKITLIICILIFGGVGVFLTFFYGNTNKYDSKTTADRIEVSTRSDEDGDIYYPIYYFKVGDKEYACKANSGSNSYPNQKKKEVYYDSKNPKKCITEYDKSTSKTIGIVCLIVTMIIIILTIKKPSSNNDVSEEVKELDPETQEKIEKAIEAANKFELFFKRLFIAIMFIFILILILIDNAILKQTIKAKDYIPTTATYVGRKDETEDSIFNDHIYTFEDKKGNSQEITMSISNDRTPEDEINIKYNEKDPTDYYTEGAYFKKSDIIWYIVKVVVAILLVVLFFNEKLLNKIRLSVRNHR